jgi:excisionase family DNA binding protein
MAQTTDSPYLTVAQVAAVLDISTDGVYKLIKRDKLPALRLSERGLRITRWALEAYRESLNGDGPDTSLPEDTFDPGEVRAAFEAETGMSPESWVAAWKHDEIADSAANNARLVQALALREHDGHGAAIGKERWAVAAFGARGGLASAARQEGGTSAARTVGEFSQS